MQPHVAGRDENPSCMDSSRSANDSPTSKESRPTTAELQSRFPNPLSIGIHPLSMDKVGEGNYGYVLQGAATVASCHDAPSSTAYAIKVVPIRATWTLDEAKYTQRISDAVTALTSPVPLRAAKNTTQCSASSLKAADGDLLRLGSECVLTLTADIAYDADTDALWIPLTWTPVTLQECIHQRKQQQQTGERTTLFSTIEVQHVLRRVLQALHFLTTGVGLVHLDVKPSNVLLKVPWWDNASGGATAYGSVVSSRRSEKRSVPLLPEIFLGDYGLVQPIGGSVAQLGDFVFMAPEIYWCGDDALPLTQTTPLVEVYHPQHDTWSVGVLLLNLLEGECPFLWEGRERFVAMEDNYLVPMVKNTSMWPSDLLSFLLQCFERDVRRRPTAKSLLEHPFLHAHL